MCNIIYNMRLESIIYGMYIKYLHLFYVLFDILQ